jgi:hypothetical protein
VFLVSLLLHFCAIATAEVFMVDVDNEEKWIFRRRFWIFEYFELKVAGADSVRRHSPLVSVFAPVLRIFLLLLLDGFIKISV